MQNHVGCKGIIIVIIIIIRTDPNAGKIFIFQ